MYDWDNWPCCKVCNAPVDEWIMRKRSDPRDFLQLGPSPDLTYFHCACAWLGTMPEDYVAPELVSLNAGSVCSVCERESIPPHQLRLFKE